MDTAPPLDHLATSLDGDLATDQATRLLYATDASMYQEMPMAVAFPRHEADIQTLVRFAGEHGASLIPRTAGTSLAGQVVGNGIVVDVSRDLTAILDIDPAEGWVRVQPGVIRNDLNQALALDGLMFGPETSTANRAMIGGMLGNNSCGSNSVVYGSTRDHVLAVRAVLSDGSIATFRALAEPEFQAACGPEDGLEAGLYRHIRGLLSAPAHQVSIRDQFPDPSIQRRNTGYALDALLGTAPFTDDGAAFNFSSLVAGSEGTLCFATEITLACVPPPPRETALLCAHFETIDQAMQATVLAMAHHPSACELIDRFILDCTKNQIKQRRNRAFVKGDPGAILAIELRGKARTDVDAAADRVIDDLKASGLGFHYPVLHGEERLRVWALRAAGLGLLSNIPGDAKPVAFIEDTAVPVPDLPAYIRDLNQGLRERFDTECVHYGHAGSGELHLRPILNLKDPRDVKRLRDIAEFTAGLVKSYRGSLSGEHGDGRLRGEFLPRMLGEDNYRLLQSVKQAWDPQGIFNPGKIVGAPPMDESLRYRPGQATPEYPTRFDWSADQGILRAAERCNGSGDCRKPQGAGGTMCPSYMATRNERDSTRGRANLLRHALTHPGRDNPFTDEAMHQALDLCLSCKGCKAECPSNVDMARLKAEVLHQRYRTTGIPRRARAVAGFAATARWGTRFPGIWNRLVDNPRTASLLQQWLGFSTDRPLPRMPRSTLRHWFRGHMPLAPLGRPRGDVLLFCDEFTDLTDPVPGIRTVQLLERLGYRVQLPRHGDSGRAALSKGLLDHAARAMTANVTALAPQVSEQTPLVGIEPSALLGFRDEAPDLVSKQLRETARSLGANSLLLEELLDRTRDQIDPAWFTDESKTVFLHGHCHQKALASVEPTVRALSIPTHYRVHTIPSGCCGMAGSFGYEKEHYDLSLQIAELVLLPAVREIPCDALLAAPGTSCRHQIDHGAGRTALHPAEILFDALASAPDRSA